MHDQHNAHRDASGERVTSSSGQGALGPPAAVTGLADFWTDLYTWKPVIGGLY